MMYSVDDFLERDVFESLRERAINATYVDWTSPIDGEVYKHVAMDDMPELKEAMLKLHDGLEWVGSTFRVNYEGELPNRYIHSDVGYADIAVVFYLNALQESGTATWRHIATDSISTRNSIVIPEEDFNNPDKWVMTDMRAAKQNRVVAYDAQLYHSRYPFEGYGSTPANGRLVAVMFAKLRSNNESSSKAS